ncbi:MAG TPA: membrane protein insertion efficiency factor YidD [Bacteroides sp.]|nr:membrane protein insertion efficiency factor YidD [Bacteroides sp.]
MHARAAAENTRNSIRFGYFTQLSRVFPAGASFIHLFEPEAQEKIYPVNLRSSDSEIEILLKIGYLGYKEFLSSQDVDACVFHPSCSNYTIEAIEIKGVVTGLLEGFDRVSRCHPFVGKHDYPYDTRTMKSYDTLISEELHPGLFIKVHR